MDKDIIFCLIKFGAKEHMENLLNGEVYFNLLSEHGNSQHIERGDPNEGVYEMENLQLKAIKCKHPILGTFNFIPIPNSDFKLTKFDNRYNFSIYSIDSKLLQDDTDHFINEKMIEFGEYAVMINNPTLFINSIISELNIQKKKFHANLVTYRAFSFKEKITLSLFEKELKYKHQNEFRILVEIPYNEIDDHFILNIKPIKEYSVLSKSTDMIKAVWKKA